MLVGLMSRSTHSSTSSKLNLIEEKLESRGEWDSTTEFILSCLGCSIGLGNIWRFPYLVGKSGGGRFMKNGRAADFGTCILTINLAAFLIPYVIIMVLAGLPVFYMELSLGQYAATGPLQLFQRICPALQGISVCSFDFICSQWLDKC